MSFIDIKNLLNPVNNKYFNELADGATKSFNEAYKDTYGYIPDKNDTSANDLRNAYEHAYAADKRNVHNRVVIG